LKQKKSGSNRRRSKYEDGKEYTKINNKWEKERTGEEKEIEDAS
jgi:hypothetical protein